MAYSVAVSGDPTRGRKITGVLSTLSAERCRRIRPPVVAYSKAQSISAAVSCPAGTGGGGKRSGGNCGLPADSAPHGREQHHLAKRPRPGQDHRQAVDSQADPGRGRHPVLERLEERFVERLGVLVAALKLGALLLEAAPLLVRIVELRERVGDLDPAYERLPALHQPLFGAVALGERRQLDRIVEHKGRLSQL